MMTPTAEAPNNTPDARLADILKEDADQQYSMAEHENSDRVRNFHLAEDSYNQAQQQNPAQTAVPKPVPPMLKHVVVTGSDPLTMTVTMLPYVPPPPAPPEGQLGPSDSPVDKFWKLSQGHTGAIVHWFYNRADMRGGVSHYREGDTWQDYIHHTYPNPWAPDNLFHCWEGAK
jgi:hypothetical protein